MIEIYSDRECRILNSTLNLKLENEYTALWFCLGKECDSSSFLEFMATAFDSYTGYFWHAFSGGTGSTKILDLKRAFGHWSIPRGDIVSMHDSLDEKGERLYSDIAQVKPDNVSALSKIFNRTLFGVDSTLFFLPVDSPLPTNTITKPLSDLLVKRNGMGSINERSLNQGYLEEYIKNIMSINGIATMTVRDSNMNTMIIAIGKHASFKAMGFLNKNGVMRSDLARPINEQVFNRKLDVGVSLAVFG